LTAFRVTPDLGIFFPRVPVCACLRFLLCAYLDCGKVAHLNATAKYSGALGGLLKTLGGMYLRDIKSGVSCRFYRGLGGIDDDMSGT